MKIAVVGCGAVGSFYGGLLCRDGHEVHFLLRSDFDAVKQNGLRVRSIKGDFHVRPKCARDSMEIGEVDLVIVALKTTANAQLKKLLPPLIGKSTAVLTLQNGLGTEAAVAEIAGAEKTLGGLCFVCLNRTAPGEIHHIAHGTIVMGEFGRPSQNRTREIARAITRSGVDCRVTDNLEQAHWEKLVWNIPFNGLGVASAAGIESVQTGGPVNKQKLQSCLTTDRLLGDSRCREMVERLMLEIIDAARRRGLPLEDSLVEYHVTRTGAMGAYKASTVLDFELGRELELETMFFEPLRQANEAGVPAPRLKALCEVLKQLAN
jgi:2-dehydropantoate 2-reductase